ncbi:MAG TPA: hypothetical protein VHI52_06670 [Verrucomicrobiae bacterium]|nr:hypothetical protein [Verrucomicrobiae bacterium]
MRRCHIYWHIYPQDQIKPALHGNLVCLLEVPWTAVTPVVRDVFDPAGGEFPNHMALRFPRPMREDHHGIMYLGVNKAAIFKLALLDPQMPIEATDYSRYNRQIISRARNFFLLDPNLGFKAMPQHMVQLL